MSSFTQLPLALSYRKAFGREDFVVAPCNHEAVSWIDRWPSWPSFAVLIHGEHGSGKTHLSCIFSEYRIEASDLTDSFMPYFQKKIVVENLENLKSEEALLHLFNFIRDMGGSLLLTAEHVPDFHLPDLKSRIQSIPKAGMEMPDEQLILKILKQAFAERQILVDEAVLSYAVTHMPRSFYSIQNLIKIADELSLTEQRKITIPVIKTALEKIGG